MKREIDITELMDSYTDNEFNIGGETGVEAEKVVSAVLLQVKQKKKMKPKFKVLIAAAAAAIVLAGGATAAGFISKGAFTTATNMEYGYDIGEDYVNEYIDFRNAVPPAELEDGRVYFTLDGAHTDITELIDRTTPYIYSYTNAETRQPIHIVVGGEPENYAFVELVKVDGLGWQGIGSFLREERYSWSWNAQVSSIPALTFEDGWYLTKGESVMINIVWDEDVNGDGELQYEETFYHLHDGATDISETWEKDCMDAWLISAMLQLDLFEMPDRSLIHPIELTEDGRVILVVEGQYTDITGLIDEETPYIYPVEQYGRYGEKHEGCILVGGTPGDYGWTLLCHYENERESSEWIGAEENITYIIEALSEDERDTEKYRDWYLNGVHEIGYNQGELHVSRNAVRKIPDLMIGTRVY